MAQTPVVYKACGDMIDYTPSGAVTAGDVIVQGTLVGVAKSDIAAGTKGALAVVGIFDVPKDASNLTAIGTAIYWDADGNPVGGTVGSGAFTATATGNPFAGWCLEVAGVGVGTVRAFICSSLAVSVTTVGDLTDCGTISHAAGAIIVGDGSKFEEVAVSGAIALAATGAVTTVVATKAAAGNSQGTATAITAEGFCLVSAADATKGVKLPAAAAGKRLTIKNGANAVLKVYPGTDDAINALQANASLDMAAYAACELIAYDATTWYTNPLLPS